MTIIVVYYNNPVGQLYVRGDNEAYFTDIIDFFRLF
jgi:hypothetical protein